MSNRTALVDNYRNSLEIINTRGHWLSLWIFMVVVVAHWAEHVVQVAQVYVLNWPIPEARGLLGIPFPWLVTSEWLHYGYALIMLIGLILLTRGFVGRSLTWWKISLWLQVWHHFEHLLLLLQAMTGKNLAGYEAPMSLIQFVIPRIELHLFYNALVFAPMVVAMYLHAKPNDEERALMKCTCADREEE